MTGHVQHVRQVKQWRSEPDDTGVQTTEVTNRAGPTDIEQEHTQNVASRAVWYIAGILLTLLAFRFVLALLGANPANGFADFIYSVTYPFVAPFFGLFNYDLRYSVAHFELYTLVAMLVYAVVAYGIVRLINLSREDGSY